MKTLKLTVKTILLISIFSIISFSISAQLPNGYSNNSHKGMRYGFFKPVDYNPDHKYPLVLYLHGSGDTTSWNLNWYNPPVSTEDPCFVLSPKSNIRGGAWGSSNSSTHSPGMQKTLEVMDSIIELYNIDESRLYVNGTSMGGFGTFSLLSKEPGRFAGAYSICGGGTAEHAANMKQTPLWIFHGSDDPVVSVQYSRDIYKKIKELGGTEVRYTEYPGVEHNSWDNAGQEKILPIWLLKQVKGKTHTSPDPVK
ncbi:MAG: prolyl oligopeptidase family serine peptidase [Mariniphaga sp.]|nr:prolyl oligopeptidase family serine peptidase [Mariniphaga sp.]